MSFRLNSKCLNLSVIAAICCVGLCCGSCRQSPLNGIRGELLKNPAAAHESLKTNIDGLSSSADIAAAELFGYYLNDIEQYGYFDGDRLASIVGNAELFSRDRDLALYNYYKGVYEKGGLKYSEAIEAFHTAEHFAEKEDWHHLLGMIYNKSAEVFYEHALYVASIEYAEKSAHCFALAGNLISEKYAYADKIFSLLELRKTEEAKELYAAVKDDYLRAGDVDFLNRFYGESIGILLFYDDFTGAQAVYYDWIEYKDPSYTFSSEHLLFAMSGMESGESEPAYAHLSQAGSMTRHIYDEILLKYIYSKYFDAKGDYESALRSLEEHIELYQSTVNEVMRTSLVRLEEDARFFRERMIYQDRIAKHRIWLLLGGFGLLSAIVSLLLYRSRNKSQNKDTAERLALGYEIISELRDSNSSLLSKLNERDGIQKELKEFLENKLAYAKQFAELHVKYSDQPSVMIDKAGEQIDLLPQNNNFIPELIHTVNSYYYNPISG